MEIRKVITKEERLEVLEESLRAVMFCCSTIMKLDEECSESVEEDVGMSLESLRTAFGNFVDIATIIARITEEESSDRMLEIVEHIACIKQLLEDHARNEINDIHFVRCINNSAQYCSAILNGTKIQHHCVGTVNGFRDIDFSYTSEYPRDPIPEELLPHLADALENGSFSIDFSSVPKMVMSGCYFNMIADAVGGSDYKHSIVFTSTARPVYN